MSYGRFAAMIVTSTIVMFGLMYLNTNALTHVAYSQTRVWMALLMGAVMAVIMMGFMWSMWLGRLKDWCREHSRPLWTAFARSIFVLARRICRDRPQDRRGAEVFTSAGEPFRRSADNSDHGPEASNLSASASSEEAKQKAGHDEMH